MDSPNHPGPDLEKRLASMGFCQGDGAGGWTLSSIAPSDRGDAILLGFVHGPARIDVRLEPSTPDNRCFARVGRVDLTHLPVDPALTRRAGDLTRAVVARLTRCAPDADLSSIVKPR